MWGVLFVGIIMKVLELGTGSGKIEKDSIGVDICKTEHVDVVHDLNVVPYPFEDNTFDLVYAHNILEHLRDIAAVMREIHRIAKPNALVSIIVPYYKSENAFWEHEHIHFFSDVTFREFTGEAYYNYRYDFRYRMEQLDMVTTGRFRRGLPFKRLLATFLWNIYNEMHIKMRVLK